MFKKSNLFNGKNIYTLTDIQRLILYLLLLIVTVSGSLSYIQIGGKSLGFIFLVIVLSAIPLVGYLAKMSDERRKRNGRDYFGNKIPRG